MLEDVDTKAFWGNVRVPTTEDIVFVCVGESLVAVYKAKH